MKRPTKAPKVYWCGANKDGKPYRTTMLGHSNKAAKENAIRCYPLSEGYTDHWGSRRW